MSATVLIGAALLGGVGSVARFVVSELVAGARAGNISWGTVVVNLTGAFVLGVLVGAGLRGDALELVGVGLLGGYTTFSAWMLEAVRMAEDRDRRGAVAHLALSLAAGLVLAWLGRELGLAL